MLDNGGETFTDLSGRISACLPAKQITRHVENGVRLSFGIRDLQLADILDDDERNDVMGAANADGL